MEERDAHSSSTNRVPVWSRPIHVAPGAITSRMERDAIRSRNGSRSGIAHAAYESARASAKLAAAMPNDTRIWSGAGTFPKATTRESEHRKKPPRPRPTRHANNEAQVNAAQQNYRAIEASKQRWQPESQMAQAQKDWMTRGTRSFDGFVTDRGCYRTMVATNSKVATHAHLHSKIAIAGARTASCIG